LERLIRADLFEQVLQSRYLGTKRFSLEGVTALIPLLDSILDTAGEHGAVESVMAMSHRGRLNVMVHAACKAPHEVVAGFEDVDPRSVLGAGDVKYHVGATARTLPPRARKSAFIWSPTRAIWKAVDPVAMGRARAKADTLWLRQRLQGCAHRHAWRRRVRRARHLGGNANLADCRLIPLAAQSTSSLTT